MKTREHYTSIAPYEEDHQAAMCGCVLERDDAGIVRFYQCALHDAAPEMLVLIHKAHKDLCGCQTMGDDCGWPDARALFAKIEGKE